MNEICDNNPWYGCGCPEHTDSDRFMRPRNGSARSSMVHVRRADLLYKIQNAASIVKDSIPDESGTHEMRAWIEDLTADGNIDRVTDLLDLAFADLLEWLDGRVDPDTYECDIDLDVDDDYTIMTRRAITPTKARRVLKPRVEEYMVAYVLYEWLSHKGFMQLAAKWSECMNDMKSKISNLLSGSRAKRPLSPF